MDRQGTRSRGKPLFFKKVDLGGDTDFGLTAHFDKRDEKCEFVLGMDARPNPVKIADAIDGDRWRYFFYATNDRELPAEQVVEFYRGRADHENDIEQLKNGVRALHAPSDSLLSN